MFGKRGLAHLVLVSLICSLSPEAAVSGETPGQTTNGSGETGTTQTPEKGDGQGTTQTPEKGDGQGTTQTPEKGDGQGTTQTPEKGDGQGTTQTPEKGDGQGTTQTPEKGDGQGAAGDTGKDEVPEETVDERTDTERLQDELESASGRVYIEDLLEDADDVNLEDTIEISSSVILCSRGGATLKKGAFDGPLFRVKDSGKLTLSGRITLDGGDSSRGPLVENLGRFIINNGVKLCRNSNNGGSGGGVYNEGEFEMAGGEITNCSAQNGGGVYNLGVFEMSDGEICGNRGSKGAAVYNAGSFCMSGGAYIPGGDGNYVMLENRCPIEVTNDLVGLYNPVATVQTEGESAGTVIATAKSKVSLDPASFAPVSANLYVAKKSTALILCGKSNHICSGVPEFLGKNISVKMHFNTLPGAITGVIYDSSGKQLSKSTETLTRVSSSQTESSSSKDVLNLGSDNCRESGTEYVYKTTLLSSPAGRCKLVLTDTANSSIVGELEFMLDQTAPKIYDLKVTGATSSSTNTYKYTEEDAPRVKFYYEDSENEVVKIALSRPVKGAELKESDIKQDTKGSYVSYSVKEPGSYEFVVTDAAGNENKQKLTFNKDTTTTTTTTTTTGTNTTAAVAKKTTTATTTAAKVATTPIGKGPTAIKLVTAKEPTGKTVAKVAKGAKVVLANYLDSTFFASGSNKVEITSEAGGTVTILASDIISKAKLQGVSTATTATNSTVGTSLTNTAATGAAQTTNDATAAINYLKSFGGIDLGTLFEENDAKLKSIRTKNEEKIGTHEDISMISFTSKVPLPCSKISVSVVADKESYARALNLPINVYRVNSAGVVEEKVAGATVKNGTVTFSASGLDSNYLFVKVPVSVKNKDNSFKEGNVKQLSLSAKQMKELAQADGVKSIAINGDDYIWTITKSQAKKAGWKGNWNTKVEVLTASEVREHGLMPGKDFIIDFDGELRKHSKANLFVKVDYKNKRGVTVYALEEGEPVELAKGKTVSKNGIIALTLQKK